MHVKPSLGMSKVIDLCFIFQEPEFLVKWKDFHKFDCTWEPDSHIPRHLANDYLSPDIEKCRLDCFAREIERAVHARLKSKNPVSHIYVDLDVYRSCFGDQTKLCTLEDFQCLDLMDNWYYIMRENGSGIKLKFPVRLRPKLLERKVYIRDNGNLVKKSYPVERCILYSCTEACTLDQL